MMIWLAVLSFLQKWQIFLLWVQFHTFFFLPIKGLGLSYLSPCYIYLVITLLTLLYVLFELLSTFSFWIISLRTLRTPHQCKDPGLLGLVF